MRTLALLTVALLLLPLGCQKKTEPPQPQTTALEAPVKPVDELAPAEVPAPTSETATPRADESETLEPRQPAISKPEPLTSQPFVYTVEKGDTLWSIAKRYLGDGKRWKDIVSSNPGLDPKKLKVGQKIVLPAK